MENMDTIKLFFSKMKCTRCDNYFEDEDIEVLREEENYTVVRIHCEHCEKSIGVAILGIDKEKMLEALDMQQPEMEQDLPPIDYDDVMKAHEFFQNLGDDWLKFIPSEYK